ncbi:MAG: hypothetical protein ACHQUC_05580, partial [Chlamydiales bacterium]
MYNWLYIITFYGSLMIETCCKVPNYFENMDQQSKLSKENASTIDSDRCPCQLQVEHFQKIIALLENNIHFKNLFLTSDNPITKKSIAFYVEAVKQQPMTDWQEDLNGVEREIGEKLKESDDPNESYKQTTWYLYELITFMYKTVLNTQQLKAYPCATTLLKRLKNVEKLSNREKEKGSPIPLGGIHPSFVPPWFKHTQE